MSMSIRKGRCHCGAVEFEVVIPGDFGELRRCNCSLCRKRGVVMASVPLEHFRVTQGADQLTLYQWNTRVAEHYFCKTCGIYTHHKRRSVPTEFAYNVACMDGVGMIDESKIVTLDGQASSRVDSR